jgi:hypothetical protein
MSLRRRFCERLVVSGIAALGVHTMTGLTMAQDADKKRVAEALFRDARALMDAGKYDEACPKFAASQRADPSIGTELNLADCYERTGKTASAWALFRDAVRGAQREGRADREKVARERAAALEPALPRMLITVPDTGRPLEIRRNGEVLDPGLVGTAEPLDPGRYVLEASAAGRRTWTRDVDIDARAQTVQITIPPLEAVAPPPPRATTQNPQPAHEAPRDRGAWSTQATLALVAAGSGLAGLATGTAMGLTAVSHYSEAKSRCTPTGCDDAARAKASSAEELGNAATAVFVAGAVLATAALPLWLTAPRGPSRARLEIVPAVATTTAAVLLRGAF